MKTTHHPLAERLIKQARIPWIIDPYVRPDIDAGARLIDDQNTAISQALEAALDNDLKKCIEILADASNVYPFLTDAEKKERETP